MWHHPEYLHQLRIGIRRLRRRAAASRAGLAAREGALTGALAQAWVEFESMKPFWRRAAAVRVRG